MFFIETDENKSRYNLKGKAEIMHKYMSDGAIVAKKADPTPWIKKAYAEKGKINFIYKYIHIKEIEEEDRI